MKYIAFSGGVESTTMCLLYGEGATAIFTDTGSEHKVMYEWIDKVESEIKKIHNDFTLLRLKASVMAKEERVSSLTDYIRKMAFFPSPTNRFCTRHFKIELLDLFLKTQGDCELSIGLNEDERDRVGNHGLVDTVKYSYPLQKNNLTRLDCIQVLKGHNLNPKFPAYMQRGGCIFCPFKSKKEYAAMVHLAPEELELVLELEENIQDTRGKYYRIRQNMPSMRHFIDIEKNNLFGDLSEYYDDVDDSPSCGVFCHR